jgi:hypothetical protein
MEVIMAQSDSTFASETTIYNYRLLKRIPHSLYMMFFYIALILLLQVVDISKGLWWLFIVSFPIILLMQSIIVWVYFYFTVGRAMRGWSFHWGLFWNGILPDGHASIRLIQKVQFHLCWVGVLVLAGLSPWVHNMFWVNLLLIHLWLMLPRLIILLLFRPFRKSGLIRISLNETSCYLP